MAEILPRRFFFAHHHWILAYFEGSDQAVCAMFRQLFWFFQVPNPISGLRLYYSVHGFTISNIYSMDATCLTWGVFVIQLPIKIQETSCQSWLPEIALNRLNKNGQTQQCIGLMYTLNSRRLKSTYHFLIKNVVNNGKKSSKRQNEKYFVKQKKRERKKKKYTV